MIKLNDYLYEGHTVLKILYQYAEDLKENARQAHNPIDQTHSNFLQGIAAVLEHNDFLTSQSLRMRELYKYLAREYPQLAFTFRGRLKSLIRSEEKFNGYIIESVSERYRMTGTCPSIPEIRARVNRFHDLIAYRIIISIPRCHLSGNEDPEELECATLYKIANEMPDFLEERGFTPLLCGIEQKMESPLLGEAVRPYYRDYIANRRSSGYRSLHITFYDNLSRCYMEVQLRTKSMDDYAEIGEANHSIYEVRQDQQRMRRDTVPQGASLYFDEACERAQALRTLDLSKVDVNMFSALDNYRVNDGCGLYRGRLIMPLEHLSRFQNDEVG